MVVINNNWCSFAQLQPMEKQAITRWIWEWNPDATNAEQQHEQTQYHYSVEWITLAEAKQRCMERTEGLLEEFGNFDTYHAWYQEQCQANGDNRLVIHEDVWPCIEGKGNEWLQDGWHRFHSYVMSGVLELPIIKMKTI